ncbi:MAG: L-rhamnose mutarotase [Eubacteriales bacterium]|nr:L-rhamnose mutarotase [Eubacteriales bacterium]
MGKTAFHTYCLRVKPQYREEYLENHMHVWPEVEAALKRAGVASYRIWITPDNLLIAVVEFQEGCDMQDVARESAQVPRCQEWEAYMANMQRPCEYAKSGEWWCELPAAYELIGE